MQHQGKIVTNKVFLSLSFKYLCKAAVDGTSAAGSSLMKVIFTFIFVAITYGKVSLWLWESMENSGNFFLLLCSHPDKTVNAAAAAVKFC